MLASDGEREGTLRRLRACHVEGLLGSETFEHRVGATLRATRRAQLASLVLDLPTRRTALRDAVTALVRGREAAEAIDVELPGWADPAVVLGRSRGCDVRLTDDTVSARHAELRPLLEPGRWLLVDLGSLNGTWLLGRRIGRTVVRAGDRVVLGGTVLQLLAP